MKCANCGNENPSDARFCLACGQSMVSPVREGTRLQPDWGMANITCLQCGTSNPPGKAYCGTCGSRLGPQDKVNFGSWQAVAVALILVGLLLIWQFAYFVYSGSKYDFEYWDTSDWVDTVLRLLVGLIVVIAGFVCYPKQHRYL